MSRRRARTRADSASDSDAERDAAWARSCVSDVWLEPECPETARALAEAQADFAVEERPQPTAAEESATMRAEQARRAPPDDLGRRLLVLSPLDPDRVFVESIRKQVSDKCDELERETASALRGEQFARAFDRSLSKKIGRKRKHLKRALDIVRANIDAKFDKMCASFVESKLKIATFEADPSLTGHTKAAIVGLATSKLHQIRNDIIVFANGLFHFSNECIQEPADRPRGEPASHQSRGEAVESPHAHI
jgi:hypothetical protein